ncbi:hypothetical protein [Micromonospora sp. CMU55-4]|uniref:hypothetical protein n=1 Tax=Micromonospora sp. CMU55-4 TaxID=2717028 RepID=UPI00140BA6C4|nr:hypothetical protein [Micromonospora sp. CMU55-4]NHO85135.1 hypothetical protein [Micromonospora sp. CMU55-4]
MLCLVLTRGYDVSGDPNILAEAITAGEQAVRLGGVPEALTNLAVALVNLYLLTGFFADLDTAVDLGRQAAADSTAAGQAINLSNLADTLQLRFAAGAPNNVLDEAVDVAAKAVAVAGLDDPGQVTYLANLGAAHLTGTKSPVTTTTWRQCWPPPDRRWTRPGRRTGLGPWPRPLWVWRYSPGTKPTAHRPTWTRRFF